MTIGQKLTAGAAAILVFTIASGVSSLTAINSIESGQDYYIEKAAGRSGIASEIRGYALEMASLERAILIRGMLQNQDLVARHKAEFQTVSASMEERLKSINALADNDTSQAAIRDIWRDVAAAKTAHYELTGALEGLQADLAIKLYDEKVMPAAMRVADGAARFIQTNAAAADQTSREVRSHSTILKWLQVVLGAVCAFIAAVVMFIARRSSRDLQVITTEINERAQQVAEAANQVSSASRSVAEGASTQAGALETTSASSDELASMTSRNRDNAVSAANFAAQAAAQIARANATLDEMVKAMAEISSAGGQISKIIKVIDEIAFQTNILALNAAVEAARAGEAGMGFAVVAEEVRNLAQRCADAAQDTTGLIENSVAKTMAGRTNLGQVTDAIRGVTAASNEITALVQGVKLGSEEQTRGFEEISNSISRIQAVTHDTAASAEQSASFGAEMASQADALRGIVMRLQSLVGAGTTRVSNVSRARSAACAARAEI